MKKVLRIFSSLKRVATLVGRGTGIVIPVPHVMWSPTSIFRCWKKQVLCLHRNTHQRQRFWRIVDASQNILIYIVVRFCKPKSPKCDGMKTTGGGLCALIAVMRYVRASFRWRMDRCIGPSFQELKELILSRVIRFIPVDGITTTPAGLAKESLIVLPTSA